MRNLIKLALVAATLFTAAACTEDPDAEGADVLAADEPDGLVIGDEVEPELGAAAPVADRFGEAFDRVESTRPGFVDHDEPTVEEIRQRAKSRLDWLRRAKLVK